MSIVPAAGAASALIPAVANLLVSDPQLAKETYRSIAGAIKSVATKDPSGKIMSRMLGKAGFPNPRSSTKMLTADSVRDYSGSSSTPVVVRSASGSYPMGYNGAPRRGTRRARRGRIPRPLVSAYADKITTCFRGSPALSNQAANAASYAIPLAVSTTSLVTPSVFPLSNFITQWTSLASIYREFRVTKLTVDWVPRVGSTAAGEVSCCVDRDPRTGTTLLANIVRRNPFFQTDIKLPACLEWKPVDSRDREWRYTAATASRPEESLSFGVLLLASNNDLPINAIVGDLFVNVWAEFAVPV